MPPGIPHIFEIRNIISTFAELNRNQINNIYGQQMERTGLHRRARSRGY